MSKRPRSLPATPLAERDKTSVRITQAGSVRSYVQYATRLLTDAGGDGVVVLSASGPVISKAVSAAEVLKRKLSDLYQVSILG